MESGRISCPDQSAKTKTCLEGEAAIPAALPAVLTVTMAVGATALAKKEAIVSKLVAIV